MSNEQVTPINHSTGSATASTVGGAAWGGLKTGVLSVVTWIAAFTVLGIAVGSGALPLGLAFLGSGSFWGGVIGGLIGWGVGTGTSWIPGVAGTTIGAVKGGNRAATRVEQERQAAQIVQAQIAMAGAGQRPGYTVDPRYNQAASTIQAGSAESQGRLAQLERTRA